MSYITFITHTHQCLTPYRGICSHPFFLI
jgi:hypothetical protein